MAVSEQFIYILAKDRNQGETLRNQTYYRLFCDHSGYHCIIYIDDKVYYFNVTKDKVKELEFKKVKLN